MKRIWPLDGFNLWFVKTDGSGHWEWLYPLPSFKEGKRETLGIRLIQTSPEVEISMDSTNRDWRPAFATTGTVKIPTGSESKGFGYRKDNLQHFVSYHKRD